MFQVFLRCEFGIIEESILTDLVLKQVPTLKCTDVHKNLFELLCTILKKINFIKLLGTKT